MFTVARAAPVASYALPGNLPVATPGLHQVRGATLTLSGDNFGSSASAGAGLTISIESLQCDATAWVSSTSLLCKAPSGYGPANRLLSIAVFGITGTGVAVVYDPPSAAPTPAPTVEPSPAPSLPLASADCAVSLWTAWAACSQSCEEGASARTRSVTQPQKGFGAACLVTHEWIQCTYVQTCPSDCTVGVWAMWTSCSVSCGMGSSSRSRSVLSAASDGGVQCPVLSAAQDCNTFSCPIDCSMGTWQAWSSCSATCGTGAQRRTRDIAIAAASGGITCASTTDERACAVTMCPVDCNVASWGPWATCTAPCKVGSSQRSRSVSEIASGGGSACPALSSSITCSAITCIDCAIGSWSGWSSCSVECGGGASFRTRIVAAAPAEGVAQPCPATSEFVACSFEACTVAPSLSPTLAPSGSPSLSPTGAPTLAPSMPPSTMADRKSVV